MNALVDPDTLLAGGTPVAGGVEISADEAAVRVASAVEVGARFKMGVAGEHGERRERRKERGGYREDIRGAKEERTRPGMASTLRTLSTDDNGVRESVGGGSSDARPRLPPP